MKCLALLVIFLFPLVQCDDDASKRTARDSYLEAYTDSHGGAANVNFPSSSDRDYSEPIGYPYPASQPSFQYGPPITSQKVIYGPPNYNPPAPVYGPPPSQPFYGMPYAMLGLFDKLKYKLDLFTIGKIILKLILFKKIVSFIAIICLLLFIPSLKKKLAKPMNDEEEEDDDMMRKLGHKKHGGEASLNNLTNFVEEAIKRYSTKNVNSACAENSIFCKTTNVTESIERKLATEKLLKWYIQES